MKPNYVRLSLEELALILFLLETYGKLGRYALSKLTGLGEGRVRNLIRRLAEVGYIEVSKGGSKLTWKGHRLYDYILRELRVEEVLTLSKGGKEGVCFHFKGGLKGLRILEVRDEVIRGGGEEALIMEVRGGRLILLPSLTALLERSMNLNEGDLILVSLAKDLVRAFKGALRAAVRISSVSTST
ncbi:MAG: hypothetical protein B6U69_00355 [Thermofilum sp. ex4484_15]|nr:MAG: hypothetical protein B6U69_00355 [Thermofilum sp. ex4484_15]